MRRFTTLAALMTLAAGAATAFLLPAPSTSVARQPLAAPVSSSGSGSPRTAAAMGPLRVAAVEASPIGLAEVIPEADLTDADKTPPPSTFFECTLQV